jgi:hypothetical protein
MELKSLTATDSDFKNLKQKIVPENLMQRVNQICLGLENEDEFAFLCNLMETCTSISKLGQTPIVDNDEKIPDFIASFQPGCTVMGLKPEDINVKIDCFIEVKSCKKNIFKITKNDITARIKYAKRYNHPLFFAVRFTSLEDTNLWVIVDSKILKKKRKLKINDMVNQINHVLLDDYVFFINPHLHIIHYYIDADKLEGVKKRNVGTLVKLVLLMPQIEPIEIDDKLTVLFSAFFECMNLQILKTHIDNKQTYEISKVGIQFAILSNLMMSLNKIVTDNDGNPSFNAKKILDMMGSKVYKPAIFTREMVEYIKRYLNSKADIFFMMSIGEPTAQLKQLKSFE